MKVAILGAECSGKSTLAAALAHAWPAAAGAASGTVTVVPELLRTWCARQGRTPRADEQAGIALAQTDAIEACRASVVLADTTALMTAVYSDVLLGDCSLYAPALEHQRRYDLNLVCALDLPWVADGIQRDGPAVQRRVDARLREVLDGHGLAYSMVYGQGTQRTEHALQLLLHRQGLLPDAEDGLTRWQWSCEKCSDPACEHRLFSRLTAKAFAA